MLLASSGIRANGVSLARKLAERLPAGYGTRLLSGALFGEALLAPTNTLYSPVTEALAAAGVVPRCCANVTGHGWRKLMRHPATLTYSSHTLPDVPEVLRFLQRQTGSDAREAYGNLDVGAGFALYVAAANAPRTVEIAAKAGVRAWIAGVVEAGNKQVVNRTTRPHVRRRRSARSRVTENAPMQPVHLVLLPGMDGTEVLLLPLLRNLPDWLRPTVSHLCDEKGETASDLLPKVLLAIDALPQCVVLGWSFSGPLALARPTNAETACGP